MSFEQLHRAVESFAEVYCERFKRQEASVRWRSARELEVSFNISGIALSSRLQLGPSELSIVMDVPLAFRLFKARAIRAIEDEVRPWLQAAATDPPE